MQVNWSGPALNDLDGIYEFIARGSHSYAQNFVQQIMQAVDRLEEYPKSGRKIPEAKTPGKGGRLHKDSDVRRLLPDYGRLNPASKHLQGWLDDYREARNSLKE